MPYQIVEKGGFGMDWSLVRYEADVLSRIETSEAANDIAKRYLTKRNFSNALTTDEKFRNLEAYQVTDDGMYLGVLDGKDQYLTYPKDIYARENGEMKQTHSKGDKIFDRNYFQLQSMLEVSVREVRS